MRFRFSQLSSAAWRVRCFAAANFLAVKSIGACVSDCGIGQHADMDGNCVDDARCVGYCPKSASFFAFVCFFICRGYRYNKCKMLIAKTQLKFVIDLGSHGTVAKILKYRKI